MVTQPYTQTPGFLPGAAYHQRNGPPTDHSQPRLTYFITRTPSGLPVPLIPADELPFTVKLHNVSRVLQPQDTYGLQYVGTSPYTGTVFKLDSGAASSSMQRSNSQPPNEPGHSRSQSSTPSKQFLAPDALVRQAHANSGYTSSSNPAMHSIRPSEAATTWRRSEPISTTSTQGVIDAILHSEAGAETAERIGYRSRDTTPPPSGIMPDQDKKVFCTHWIMTGDCKFVQQGCRYKHEMPSEAKLKELGIRHTPRWWQEQNAAIKLGGARNTVGVTVKPLEMLSRGKNDEGGDNESSSDESEVVVEMIRQPPVKPNNTNIHVVGLNPKQTLKPNKTPAPVPSRYPTRFTEPPSAAQSDLRKASTASDLIDFGTARLTPNLTPKPTITTSAATATAPTPPTKTTLVFVPAGESPKDHIAAMKKRDRATRGNKNSTSSPSSAVAASRTQSQSVVESAATSTPGVAVAVATLPNKRNNNTTNTNNRAGCRVRRPVVAAVTTPSTSTSASASPSPSPVVGAGSRLAGVGK